VEQEMGQLATVSQKGTAVLLRLTLPKVEQFFVIFLLLVSAVNL